jgi:hypothetical protein
MPIAIQPSHAELTAGQNEPILSLIQPFSAFPEKIEGPTVWRKEEFVSNPERWQKRWSNEQIRDLEQAFDAFEKSGKPLTDISKVRAIKSLHLSLITVTNFTQSDNENRKHSHSPRH